MPIELIFFWLTQLSPLVSPFTDLDCTKSENLRNNYGKSNGNISDGVGGDKLMTEKEFMTEEKFETEEEIEMEDLKGLK